MWIGGWAGRAPGAVFCLALAMLLAGGGARPAAAYRYETSSAVDNRQVEELHVTDVLHPAGIRLAWEYVPMGGYSPIEYEVHREGGGGPEQCLGITTNRFFSDSGPLQPGVTYTYKVRVVHDADGSTMGLPAPPPGANPNDIYSFSYTSWPQPWVTARVVFGEILAAENQAVDSRLDPRYGNPKLLDLVFGPRTYRGGLWAGYAADPSRVGRSFLKFQLPQLPAGERLWAGGAWAYHTRSAADGATVVGCHLVSDAWTAATLKWSLAPALTPGASLAKATVTQPGGPGWVSWNVPGTLIDELLGDGVLSLGLASVSEQSTGWAYFAKKEYDLTRAARVLYAYGAPHMTLDLTLSQGSVAPGDSVTGTVTLNAPAGPGGVTVSLAGEGTLVTLPGSVTVPEGSRSATFTVTAREDVTQTATATIRAVYSITRRALLQVVVP